MSQAQEWKFGQHSARFIAPDMLAFRLKGPVRMEDAREIVRILRQAAAGGPLFAMTHLSDTSSSQEVRQHLAQHIQPEWLQGIIFSSAGPLQKAAIKAVLITLYLRGTWRLLPEFVESEAHAQALVARLRMQQRAQRLQQERAHPTAPHVRALAG